MTVLTRAQENDAMADIPAESPGTKKDTEAARKAQRLRDAEAAEFEKEMQARSARDLAEMRTEIHAEISATHLG